MIREIKREEMFDMCRAGTRFTLVDVLSKDNFEKEHIPGAISVPLSNIERDAPKLMNKNDAIIVYSAGMGSDDSRIAAEKLIASGFTDVMEYKGGISDYKAEGLKLVGSMHSGVKCDSCCSCG